VRSFVLDHYYPVQNEPVTANPGGMLPEAIKLDKLLYLEIRMVVIRGPETLIMPLYAASS